MIYKRLPRQIKHSEVRYVGPSWPDTKIKLDSTFILITRHLPVAILRTSRQVYAEAHGIVTALIQKFVTESEPRAIGRAGHSSVFTVLAASIRTEREALMVSRISHYHPLNFESDATVDWSTLPYERCRSATPVPCLSSMGNQTTTRHCNLLWSNYTSEDARHRDLGRQNRYSILHGAGERDRLAGHTAFL